MSDERLSEIRSHYGNQAIIQELLEYIESLQSKAEFAYEEGQNELKLELVLSGKIKAEDVGLPPHFAIA